MMALRKLAALAVLVTLAACGGTKRKPAVLTDPAGEAGRTRPTASAGTEREETIDAGPDVRPLEGDGTSSTDFPVNDATGEGGPLADVLFAYDAAELSDEARATLEKHALWMQNHRAARIMIEGHCDERGTVDYNLALGDRRARAARDYLANLGVAGERLQTVSYGKERPLDGGSDESSHARNRRAHFVVSR
jgi:peptidoglycan-associated lipoprotein